jgi:pyruvate/2-oxoglutarate dehydrogenase complex dihydrolipoamide acyltransferase (E2) component
MGDLFGGGGGSAAPAQAPAPKPPAPMPDPDSAESKEARKRATVDALGRAGRSSTILTAPEARKAAPAAGFDTFLGSKLGQGS